MKYGIIFLLSICCLYANAEDMKAITTDGPFGLSWGSSISTLNGLGVNLIKTSSSGNISIYKSTSLPKNVSFAKSYTLLFHPSQGLQKVVMVSKNINNDITGSKGRELYKQIKSQLATKYSTPPESTEYIGVIMCVQEWMSSINVLNTTEVAVYGFPFGKLLQFNFS